MDIVMTPDQFAAFIKDVIDEEVTGHLPYGNDDIELKGVDAAATRIADAIVEMIPPGSTEKCGRCGGYVPADQIAVTGPYRTCPPCTAVIRS